MQLETGESYKFQDHEGHITIGATVINVGINNTTETIYTSRGNFVTGKLKYIGSTDKVWQVSGTRLDDAIEVSLPDIENLIYTAINGSPVSISTFADYFNAGMVGKSEHDAIVSGLNDKVAELEEEIVNLKKNPASKSTKEVKEDEQKGATTVPSKE